jgi:hypothetical protein
MSRIMREEAALYFAAEAALGEQRDEMRFAGARDAVGLQAWLRRLFGTPAEENTQGDAPTAEAPARLASERTRREIQGRVLAMLELDAVAAAR